jgi:hypothetical protein
MRKASRLSSVALIGAFSIVVAALVGIGVPNYVHSGTTKTMGIFSNLRQLDGAAQQWGIDHGRKATDTATREDLAPYLIHGWIKPVAGENYILKTLAESPEAVLTRDLEGRPKGTIFRLGTTNPEEIFLPRAP